MNFAALPLLFNGLFFSVTPTAVHTAPVKNTIPIQYQYPVPYGTQPHISSAGHCSATSKMVKVQVSFKMNDKKELQVISVSGATANVNAAIMQNLGNWMPGMASYLTVNKTYSFTVEICDSQIS